MPKTIDLSIVIPLYNEVDSLAELYDWIKRTVEPEQLSHEILFIDDGSTDGSWQAVCKLAQQDERVRGLRLNTNYGKSAALQTGFYAARGQVVITMDADLQDSPEEIPALYHMIADDGYDLVSGWKKKRYDPLSKTIPSKLFNRVTRAFSGIPLHDFNCGLKAYRKSVIKHIQVHGEMHRYIPVIAKWNGFGNIGEKVVEHRERKYGRTKFGWERFIFGFLDLLSISFVMRFRRRPMHFFGSLGTLSFLIGFVITVWLITEKVLELNKREIVEQPLFYLALVALVAGIQLFLTGFLGELFSTSTNRPDEYLVIESTDTKEI